MTQLAFVHTVEVLVVLALAIWFFARPWKALCTDIARHRLSELQDRLDMLSHEGKIDVDDPAFLATRDWLKKSDQYAYHIGYGDLVAFLIAFRGNVPIRRALDDELAHLEDLELLEELKRIDMRSKEIQIENLLVRSPVLLIFIVLVRTFIAIVGAFGGLLGSLRWLANVTAAATNASPIERVTK